MNYKDALIALIDSIESDQGIKTFSKGLYEEKLIQPIAYLGGADIKQELIEEINQANFDDESRNRKSIRKSGINLSEVYLNRQKRVNNLFYLSLISIGVAISLIIVGVAISFIAKSQAKLGIIAFLCSLFPGVISGIALWLHKHETENLKPVEHDIIKIARVELYFEMVQYLGDENLKAKAYETIIKQMDSQKRILIL